MKQIYIWNLLATRLIYVSSMERPKCKPLSCEMSPVIGSIERQLYLTAMYLQCEDSCFILTLKTSKLVID